MAHPGIITVDDREIKYKELIVIPIRPMRPREDGVTVPAETIYQVDAMDLDDRWHSFTCKATPPAEGGCPTEFVTLSVRNLSKH